MKKFTKNGIFRKSILKKLMSNFLPLRTQMIMIPAMEVNNFFIAAW